MPENGITRWTAIASLTRKGLLKAAAVLARADFAEVLIHYLAQYQITTENRKIVVINEGHEAA